MTTIVLIGCGNMGYAMLKGWRAETPAPEVHVVEPAEALRTRAAATGAHPVATPADLPADLAAALTADPAACGFEVGPDGVVEGVVWVELPDGPQPDPPQPAPQGKEEKPAPPEKFCRVTRLTIDRQRYELVAGSELKVIEWPSNGHNGAAVAFGHDGMLYITTGDGTSDSDTNLTGQGMDHLLAKLLRIDVRGATRLVVFVMLLRAVSTLLQAPSLAALPGMVFATHSAVAASFVSSVLIWVVYLALEPLARRVWPGSLVGWSRVLAGRWKDPMVGRDCLVGMLAAAVMLPSALLVFLLLRSRGALGPGVTVAGVLDALMGARFMLAAVLDALGNGIESALIIALLVVLVGAVVRVQWLSAVLVSLVLVLPQLATPLGGSVQALVNLLVLLASIVMMVRLGVLAGVVTLACAQVLGMLGLVLDPDAWYRAAALVPAAAIAIAVMYAYRVSTGGQSLVLPEAQAPRTA